MEIRLATEQDLPAQYDVFRAAISELYGRHAFPPPDPPVEAFTAQKRHLLTHDGERCFVAEADGRVVAFVAAFARESTWFLASLFVVPEFQGGGLGRLLLDAAWGEGFERRLTLTDAIQPVSNGLYGRRGLIPTTPLLSLAGRAQGERPGLEPSEPQPVALSALDRAAYGFDRALDHRQWAESARPTVWLRRGEPVAYSYRSPHGRIGPLAGVDSENAALALAAELASESSRELALLVPGTCGELVATALAAGLRITGPPGLLLLSSGAPAPRSLAISGYTLF